MKNTITKRVFSLVRAALVVCVMAATAGSAWAQCLSAPNGLWPSGTYTPSCGSGTFGIITTAGWGGEYSNVNVVAGNSYTFLSSVSTDYITVSDAAGSVAYAFGVSGGSGVTWVATVTGVVRFYTHLTGPSACGAAAVSRTRSVLCGTSAPAYNPCTSIGTMSCGTVVTNSHAGSAGAWNTYGGPFGVPGQEVLRTFTATVSGSHTITVTSLTGGWLDFFFKAASVGCNSTGWTYIDDFIGTGTSVTFNLTAGTTYYIMTDDEDLTASSVSFRIDCPVPAPDPCASIVAVSCGTSTSTTLAGSPSAYNPGGCFATPGAERVYSFTAPFSGTYNINVSGSTGTDYFDYYFKPASAGCGPTGWTCIDDITGSGTSIGFALTGGVTYLILVDKENWLGNTATMAQTWSVFCPPPPPANDNCGGAIAFTGSVMPFTTVSATGTDLSSCTFNDFNDVWFTWTAPSCGLVTFSTCGLAGFDTHLSLYTSCGAGEIACNDDFCGLQSTISAIVSAGTTYWLRAAGYNGAQGAGSISMSISPALTVDAGPNATVATGYPSPLNCTTLTGSFAGGTGPYTISWSTGETTASINVCPTVTTDYTFTVTDALGCSISDVVRVCVYDLVCGRSGSNPRIQICHKPGTPAMSLMCLPEPSISAHLGHGDILGPCDGLPACNEDAGKAAEGVNSSDLTASPNPFSTSTNIEFSLGNSADQASLKVYDLNGSMVADLFEGSVNAGQKMTFEFGANNLAAGIYMARLTTSNGEAQTVKLVIQK